MERLVGPVRNESYTFGEKALDLTANASSSIRETLPRGIFIKFSPKYLSIALGAPLLLACQSMESVAPYDRGYLAENGMQWESDAREAKLAGHVYTSKEASSGGAGAAGGGCGCN